MNFNRRVDDISVVFDKNWSVNNNNQERRDFIQHRKDYIKGMYSANDERLNRRNELLRANSVDGQVKNLNERMQAMNDNQRMFRSNDLKNNFR